MNSQRSFPNIEAVWIYTVRQSVHSLATLKTARLTGVDALCRQGLPLHVCRHLHACSHRGVEERVILALLVIDGVRGADVRRAPRAPCA